MSYIYNYKHALIKIDYLNNKNYVCIHQTIINYDKRQYYG